MRSGIVDLPLDATLQHGFKGPWSPSVAFALGVSLPLGDSATGFGAGRVGYSASGGLGFSPASRVWVYLGAGRSLTDVAMQSAFSNGSGWGDASAGVSVTDRLGVSGGFSSDIGAVDSTVGHSRSINGGFSYVVRGPTTINVNASHGVSGLAPKWSLAIGFGTAFPYLSHLGAVRSARSATPSVAVPTGWTAARRPRHRLRRWLGGGVERTRAGPKDALTAVNARRGGRARPPRRAFMQSFQRRSPDESAFGSAACPRGAS